MTPRIVPAVGTYFCIQRSEQTLVVLMPGEPGWAYKVAVVHHESGVELSAARSNDIVVALRIMADAIDQGDPEEARH